MEGAMTTDDTRRRGHLRLVGGSERGRQGSRDPELKAREWQPQAWKGWPYTRIEFPLVHRVTTALPPRMTTIRASIRHLRVMDELQRMCVPEEAQIKAFDEKRDSYLREPPTVSAVMRAMGFEAHRITRLPNLPERLMPGVVNIRVLQGVIQGAAMCHRELEMVIQVLEAVAWNGYPVLGPMPQRLTIQERHGMVWLIRKLIPGLPRTIRLNYSLAAEAAHQIIQAEDGCGPLTRQ